MAYSLASFVEQETTLDFFVCDSEIDESVLFVDSMAAEAFAQENVPVRFPLPVHVFLDLLGNLAIQR